MKCLLGFRMFFSRTSFRSSYSSSHNISLLIYCPVNFLPSSSNPHITDVCASVLCHIHDLVCSLPLLFLRHSPIWKVSEGALKAVASSRVCSLAVPRAPAAGWQPDRTLLIPVSNTTSPHHQSVSRDTAVYMVNRGR